MIIIVNRKVTLSKFQLDVFFEICLSPTKYLDNIRDGHLEEVRLFSIIKH